MPAVIVNSISLYFGILYLETHREMAGLIMFPLVAMVGTVLCSIAEMRFRVEASSGVALRHTPRHRVGSFRSDR